jgi:hypothetical protein
VPFASWAAAESLERVPASDKQRILAALAELQEDPFQGDIRKLPGLPGFRRRVGELAHPV